MRQAPKNPAGFATRLKALNVLQELAVARALMHDWLDRYQIFAAALTAWYDTWEGRYIPIADDERMDGWGYKSRDLAELAGVSHQTIENWLANRVQAGPDEVSKVATVFGWTQGQLYAGEARAQRTVGIRALHPNPRLHLKGECCT